MVMTVIPRERLWHSVRRKQAATQPPFPRVVPAKAGTHNHRWRCMQSLGPLLSATTDIGGWVPARATAFALLATAGKSLGWDDDGVDGSLSALECAAIRR